MNLSDHLTHAEIVQLRAEMDADRLFRRKAWTALACGLAAFWIVVAGVVAGVVG